MRQLQRRDPLLRMQPFGDCPLWAQKTLQSVQRPPEPHAASVVPPRHSPVELSQQPAQSPSVVHL